MRRMRLQHLGYRNATGALGSLPRYTGHALALVGSLVVLLWLTGCRHQPSAVAQVAAEQTHFVLPYGSMGILDVRWEMRAPLGPDVQPLIFAHLLDRDGNIVRTFDHPFPAPWEAGQVVVDRFHLYHSALAPPLAAGTYRLAMGLYDAHFGRWPLAVEGVALGQREYVVATVEVPATASRPELQFAAGWLPAEKGSDVQVVARRWISGQATLLLAKIPPTVQALWFRVTLPHPPKGVQRILAPGAPQAMLEVRSDCSGFSANLTGEGRHELRVPLDQGSASCRILFTPNFYLRDAGTGQHRAVVFEQLGWRLRDGAASVQASSQPTSG